MNKSDITNKLYEEFSPARIMWEVNYYMRSQANIFLTTELDRVFSELTFSTDRTSLSEYVSKRYYNE